MTLFQEAWEFLGPKGVPVALAGTAFMAFEFLEKISSEQAKNALSSRIRAFDVSAVAALPEGTLDIFQGIFGPRHFSFKCLIRSACFSIGVIALLWGIALMAFPFLLHLGLSDAFTARPSGPAELNQRFRDVTQYAAGMEEFAKYYSFTFVFSWVVWSLVPDYINLFKTRIILNVLGERNFNSPIFISILVFLDIIITIFIFCLGYVFMKALAVTITSFFHEARGLLQLAFHKPDSIIDFVRTVGVYFWRYLHNFGTSSILNIVAFRSSISLTVLFYAGLMPSIWLWLYVASLFITRSITRSSALLNWLRWFLPIDKSPFRALGVVAGCMTFVISAGILVALTAVS